MRVGGRLLQQGHKLVKLTTFFLQKQFKLKPYLTLRDANANF